MLATGSNCFDSEEEGKSVKLSVQSQTRVKKECKALNPQY